MTTMFNYNTEANTDDGSCIEFAYGCTDPTAWNYDSGANTDDGFMYTIYLWLYGCMQACNYDSAANTSDGSCWYAETYYDCDLVCLVDDVRWRRCM